MSDGVGGRRDVLNSSKCLIGGPRNVLKARVAVLVDLPDILKVLVGMLLVVRVFCCPQYRNWQSLMCNEALNGGGGSDVYLGAMILLTYMSVHLYIVRRIVKLNI